jgi:hypothetical protein
MIEQLSPEHRKVLAGSVNPLMPTVNQLFDKALGIPGVAELLRTLREGGITLKSINIQVPSGKMDIIDYIQQRGGYVASYTPRERQDSPMTSVTVRVDLPEDRQDEIISQIKQLGGNIIDTSPEDKTT